MTGILNIQIKPIIGDKKANLTKIEQEIETHKNKKLDLVVMPEFFSTGISHEQFEKYPEDENGGYTIEFLKCLAKKYNINIVAGTVIEKVGNEYYNTTFAINRGGETIGKYRKIHLFNYMGGNEGELITQGDKEVVVDMDFGKVGLAICFDIRYPLHFKKLTKMGAEIIVLPTAWVIPKEVYENSETLEYASEMWSAMNRTRAYDNMVYTVISDQTGNIENRATLGNSMIIAPNAQILAKAEVEETSLYCDIDLELGKCLRQIYPAAWID